MPRHIRGIDETSCYTCNYRNGQNLRKEVSSITNHISILKGYPLTLATSRNTIPKAWTKMEGRRLSPHTTEFTGLRQASDSLVSNAEHSASDSLISNAEHPVSYSHSLQPETTVLKV